LIQAEGASPHSIMAMTFTNKAAGEMRARIESLLGMPGAALWIGTFHGIAHRLLRLHWREANLPQTFQILDGDDQLRLIKKILKAQNLDDTRWVPRDIQYFINQNKDEGMRPKVLKDGNDPTRRQFIQLYRDYEEACQRAGVVDFAELLLRAFELWRDQPELLAHYRRRFGHVLVDEFQDTNTIQYAWTKLLVGSEGAPFAVGDDDQSIYRWRGARVENLQTFRRDFPQAKLIRLEQNYRSTSTILEAANALIANNSGRLGKNLWTSGGKGEPIRLYAAFNERDEAEFVLQRIKDWVARGGNRRDIAILYRSNAQSRVFEEAFLSARIPYKVYGGLRFFERAEIKHALAYMRLLENPNDDTSFARVVNFPTRGIGARSLEALQDAAKLHQCSFYAAASFIEGKAGSSIAGFVRLIEHLRDATKHNTLPETVEYVIQHSGLIQHYLSEREGQDRVENLQELINAATAFVAEEGYGQDVQAATPPGEDQAGVEDISPLAGFLAHASLEAGDNQAEAGQDAIQLMTVHSAKGLEFSAVFMTGLEEGLFPHENSISEPHGLEEERRLMYVAITRAKERLYLSHTQSRMLHGQVRYNMPSRFLDELPIENVKHLTPKAKDARWGGGSWQKSTSQKQYGGDSIDQAWWSGDDVPVRDDTNQSTNAIVTSAKQLEQNKKRGHTFRVGQEVFHTKFGEGRVSALEGEGLDAKAQVNFKRHGAKWLQLSIAKLVAV